MDLLLLERRVGRLMFANPVMFGGGTCKIVEDVINANRTDAGGIEIGTVTPGDGLPGNPGSNFHATYVKGVLIATLNSLGMPNPGKNYWNKYARGMIRRAHDTGKKIGINVAANTVDEIIDMVLWAIEMGFDWVTINAGCPNKYKDGKPVGTLTFDFGDVERLLEQLEIRVFRPQTEIWFKPSPDNDTVGALPARARLIGKSSVISGYIANNTVPHCFAWTEDGSQAIDAGNGRAGMGGPAVKLITAGHLHIVDEILPKHMARVASGGAIFGSDVVDHLRSRADAVQIASLLWVNNMDYRCVNQLLAEVMDVPDVEDVLAPR